MATCEIKQTTSKTFLWRHLKATIGNGMHDVMHASQSRRYACVTFTTLCMRHNHDVMHASQSRRYTLSMRHNYDVMHASQSQRYACVTITTLCMRHNHNVMHASQSRRYTLSMCHDHDVMHASQSRMTCTTLCMRHNQRMLAYTSKMWTHPKCGHMKAQKPACVKV